MLTEETKKGGEIVNSERRNNKIKELELVFAALIYSSKESIKENKDDIKSKISSSNLRKGLLSLINLEDLDYLFNLFFEYNSKFDLAREKSIKWFSIIRDLYSQSWRKYHSINHILYLIKSFENINKENNKLIKNKNLVFYSIIFHDIIYTASRNDNEDVINLNLIFYFI